jgi:hypothetical protein
VGGYRVAPIPCHQTWKQTLMGKFFTKDIHPLSQMLSFDLVALLQKIGKYGALFNEIIFRQK